MNLTIDQVTDNGDNSLTIVGHDDDDNQYETGMGRKSELPAKQADQMAYYQSILEAQLPPETPILYQTPEYARKVEAEQADSLSIGPADIVEPSVE